MLRQTTQSQAFERREFAFSQEDFTRIVSMLNEDAGISLAEAKAPLVYARLVKRLRALGLESFRDYCAIVDGPNGANEREQMVAALTTNITRFFREPHHFEHLKTKVFPECLEKARRGRRLRLWSAGCSTGEEPYSMALAILSVMPDAFRFDVKVLATDINKIVLAEAERGIYRESSIAPISRQHRADWFHEKTDPHGEKVWEVGPQLRTLVAFRELNLIGAWPLRQAYQVIFCRNVVIYFEENARAEIWSRFADRLAPRGRLYVGHSERVPDERFELEESTTYRLRDGGRRTGGRHA